jgi:predicted metal-dependent hydrolase
MHPQTRPALIGIFHTELDGQPIIYTLKKSSRARQARLEVRRSGGLILTLPRSGGAADAPAILEKNRRWILKKLAFCAPAPPLAQGPPDRVTYLGQEYHIAIVPNGHGPGYIKLEAGCLQVTSNLGEARLNSALEAWFRQEAKRHLAERATALCQQLGLSYHRLVVKDQRTRWGSCSRYGNLNFNWRLMMAPPEVIDYLVTHEVMHLKERRHNDRYWELVALCCPDWRRHRRWLKENEPRLVACLRP